MSVPGRPRRRRARAWARFARAARSVGAALVAVALAPAVASAADPPPPLAPGSPPEGGEYAIDPKTGHPFRVRFDPGRRFSIGAAAAAAPLSEDALTPTLELDLGLSVRSIFTFGAGAGRVIWQIEHGMVSGWVWPERRLAFGAPAMDAVLYSVSLHRHDEAPSAVLPFSPPVSVPFPFDVGFEADAGRVSVPGALPEGAASGAATPMLRIGVLRASFFLDPWRSVVPGRSIEIGVGARYDIDLIERSPSGGLRDAHRVHRIAPMTATSLRFRFQSQDGLTALDLRGDVIPHWTSEQTWKVMALASGRVERTLLAINDKPIAAVLEGDYRRTPESELVKAMTDVRVSLGLLFNVQIP